MPRRILFVPFGSEGDLNPLIWLAEGLVARGDEALFLVTPHYRRLVESKGLAWRPMGTEEDFEAFARNPDVWHPRKGPTTIIRGMTSSLDQSWQALTECGTDFDLIVTSTIALAAGSYAEKHKIPELRLHMQPAVLRCLREFPLFMNEMGWLCRSPRFIQRAFLKMVDQIIWRMALHPLNQFRRRHGLPAFRDFYAQALNGATGVGALFPEWFAGLENPPTNLRQFGFPVRLTTAELPPDLQEFLDAGPPPLVWTHGSANFDIRHFQESAVRISRELGERCLLVSLDRPDLSLPSDCFHIAHVRFENLFPRCRLAIHHGGIGTTAKAIASGIPQIIIPKSHDQPDNAQRVEQLGIGRRVPYRLLDTPKVGQVIRQLMQQPDISQRCEHAKSLFWSYDPLSDACTWAQSLAGKK